MCEDQATIPETRVQVRHGRCKLCVNGAIDTTVKVQSAARRCWEGVCYMIAFHCHTVSYLWSFLFWDGYFFNWEEDIDTDMNT